MAYRDFEAARLEERRMLVEEIERLDAERWRLESNLRRRDDLSRQLRELDGRMGSPSEEHTELLESMSVASPCSSRWDDMIGDDPRVRFCPSCAKNVYDVSSLTEVELRDLVERTEGRFCGRLRRREDGTVLANDCPVGLKRKRRLGLAAAAMAATGAAAGASLQAQDSQPTRSLLLVVKYVDRVSTEVQEHVEPRYSVPSYPEDPRPTSCFPEVNRRELVGNMEGRNLYRRRRGAR